jgi:hypothetical protein
MKIGRNLTAIAAVAAALTISAEARADTVNFFLSTVEGSTTTTPTMGGSVAPNPQVEVLVDELTTTTATVEFEISGGTFKAPVGINVDGFFDVTGVVGSGTGNGVDPCGFGITACSGGGTNHAGSFNFETSAVNSGTITIDLTAENGTTWADAAAVLVANSNGWEAADNMASSPQDLGYLAATPLPAALPLFAGGLGMVGFLARRKKRNAQSELAAA